MPIYAYACRSCGHAFDRLQKLSDPDPEVCPVCGAVTVHRQVTAPAFRLAGSGWYETDFKKDGDKKQNLANAAEPARKQEGGASESKESPSTTDKAAPKTTPEKAAAPASGSSSSGSSPS